MIRIGIAGYGNLGRGVEAAVKNSDDMELVAVFTRRDPESVKIRTEGAGVYGFDKIADFKDKIDVIVNCGGSATDLPKTTPMIAENFSVIDSFDTHAKFRSILPMLTQRRSQATILRLFPSAGIRAFSPSTDFT